jgi:hypothetical protein
METHRPSLLMTRGTASSPWAPARSSGHRRQAKAAEGADMAVVLQAVMPEAVAPSKVESRQATPGPVPAPGLESQARPPALHIHLWLDHIEAFPKGPASSKRAASDQGGLGAIGGGQGCKEGKYTLDAVLDQPCKFHNTPGREATHSTRQCRFMRELEQRARQLPRTSQA